MYPSMLLFSILLLIAIISTGGLKSKNKHSKGIFSSEDTKRSTDSNSKFSPPKSGSSSESDCQDLYLKILTNPDKACSKKFLAMYMDFIANTPTDANATACDSVVAYLRANTTFADQPTTQNCLSEAIKVQEIFATNLGYRLDICSVDYCNSVPCSTPTNVLEFVAIMVNFGVSVLVA